MKRYRKPVNTPELIWAMVDKRGPDECWPWLRYKNERGYGTVSINGKSYKAHRVIFNLANPGVIALEGPKNRSESGYLLHSCDNPTCCNPAHLKVGTHADNMADMKAKGRSTMVRAKLSDMDVAFIRSFPELSAKWLGAALGVSHWTIFDVRSGRSFA